MQIIQLTAENLKRLRAVEITPDGAIVQVTGRNAQGKTSVLDAIAYAIGGREQLPPKPVRDGEEKATIVVRLGDLVVTRIILADGRSSLTVTKDGAKCPGPQAILDELVGKLTLDPLEFVRMSPKAQVETLKGLVGLDFTEMDAERAQLFSDRTASNRHADSLKAQAEALPAHEDTPEEEESVTDLTAELQRRQTANSQRALAEREIISLRETIASCQGSAQGESDEEARIAHEAAAGEASDEKELARELAALKKRYADRAATRKGATERAIAAARSRREAQQKRRSDADARLKLLVKDKSADLNVEEVRQQIDGLELTNRKVRENARKAEAMDAAATAARTASDMTDAIKAIDAEKARLLAEAKFPIPGLSFDDSGVTFNNIPLQQASSAEQLRTSVAIGLTMNPKLQVLLVRDGSLLDKDGMKMMEKIAKDHNAQIWIERVEEAEGASVVIEDGMVVPAAERAVPEAAVEETSAKPKRARK